MACWLIDAGSETSTPSKEAIGIGGPLVVLIRDPESRQIAGGILRRTSLCLLFIDLIFLPEELRVHQIGTRTLRMAEEGL
jgi:hypothetical protein